MKRHGFRGILIIIVVALVLTGPVGAQPEKILKGHTNSVWFVAWRANGTQLVSGSFDGTVRIWDSINDTSLKALRPGLGGVMSAALSSDGRQMAVGYDEGNEEGKLDIWDITNGTLKNLSGHPKWVAALAWNLDGTRLASSSARDYTIRIWDTTTGALLRILEDDEYVYSLAWSPDGAWLASGGSPLRIWDPNTGVLIKNFSHNASMHSLSWSPDGAQLAGASSADNTVRIWTWDPPSGFLLKKLSGHNGSVNAVAWSPDGTLLASASYDGTIRIWDPITDAQLATFRGDTSAALSIAWNPDGKRLASGSGDGIVHIWNVSKISQSLTGPMHDTETSNSSAIGHTYFARTPRIDIKSDRDDSLELVLDNPEVNEADLNVEVTLTVPEGVTIVHWFHPRGPGRYTSDFQVRSGQKYNFGLVVASETPGRKTIEGHIIYYPVMDKNVTQEIRKNISMNFATKTKSSSQTPKPSGPTPKPPGFEAALAIAAVLALACLRRRR